MNTEAASSTQLYTSHGGAFQYAIRPFDRCDEEQVTFLRRRLSREVPGSMSSFLRVAMNASSSVVLFAFHTANLSSPSQALTSSAVTPKPIGVILFDVSPVAEEELAALLWVSVVFDMSGVGVGTQLVADGERAVESLGAKVIETSGPYTSDFSHRMGYTRCHNPAYYSSNNASRKVLTGHGPAAGPPAHPQSHAAKSGQDGVTTKVDKVPTLPNLPKSSDVRGRAEKRPREDTSPSSSAALASSAAPLPSPSPPVKKRSTDTLVKLDVSSLSTTPSLWSSDSSSSDRTSRLTDSHDSAASSGSATSSSPSAPPASSSADDEEESEDDYGVQYDIPSVPAVIASRDVYLRLATPSDKKAWWDLILATTHYNVGGTELLPSTLEAPFRVVAVRCVDSALVGLVAMQADGWITFLCTDESYQGQGLGSFLMFVALEWARRHGLDSASLSPLRISLLRFYRRWGFVEEGTGAGKKKKKPQEGKIVTMTRAFDPTFALLPNAATLEHYIRGYNAATEVSVKVGPTYYWYYPKPKAQRKPRDTPVVPTTSTKSAGVKVEATTPFSVKIHTLWSWLNPLKRAAAE